MLTIAIAPSLPLFLILSSADLLVEDSSPYELTRMGVQRRV